MKLDLRWTERLPLPPLDAVLEAHGRKGGGTQYGWHTWADRLTCWRKYHLLKHKKMNRYYSPALAVGTLVHEALALWYSTPRDKDPLPEIEDVFRIARESGYHRYVEEAERLFEAYTAYWTTDGTTRHDHAGRVTAKPDDWWNGDVIAVEELIESHDPYNYTCRMDIAVRRTDGIWVGDHKTARALDDSITDWSLNGEVVGLLRLARHKYGPDLKGLVINVITKTKEPQFERLYFPYRPKNVAMHVEMIKGIIAMEPVAEEAGWPPNFTSCKQGFFKCQFFDFCKDGITAHVTPDETAQDAPDEPPPKGGGADWSER